MGRFISSDIKEWFFKTFIDSPVSSDSSTKSSLASISLTSAGTFEPDSKSIISPIVTLVLRTLFLYRLLIDPHRF